MKLLNNELASEVFVHVEKTGAPIYLIFCPFVIGLLVLFFQYFDKRKIKKQARRFYLKTILLFKKRRTRDVHAVSIRYQKKTVETGDLF